MSDLANFAVEINTNSHSRKLRHSSTGEMGALDATFYVRDSGFHVRALPVVGKSDHGGRLTLTVFQASVPIWRGSWR